LSDDAGYVLYVTNIGRTVEESRTKTYSIIIKIIIPKMMYRNDIGVKFIKEDYKKLKDWGYLD
jgi:phosphoribosylamine-glycine ligase